jgi:cell division septum initiation protein DivIVA
MEWIIIILLIVLSVLIGNIVSLKRKEKSVSSENEKLQNEKEQLMKRNLELKSSNQKLAKYETALNADEEAEDRLKRAKEESDLILAGAQLQMKQIITDAENRALEILDKANDEAELIISKSQSEVQITNDETAIIKKSNKELLQRAKDEAEKIREDAARQAALILSEAENKAKEIAGEAYDIANKAKHYEEVSKAMKNVIEGYGDEYLKPTFSLLDDLADEFGYNEAGQRLKDARERTRMLMKNGDAASCDYVEKNRKDTAINFVLDAFNGKVDTILAMIKKDNYGILEQKIQDAYSLVNYLGAAFRNARINSIYLDSRLDELKWGVAVNELKLQEREEQRRIKEQIREEEKARREYEKAMRDAAKEEDTIRKAMEKAQQAIAKASEEQKAKYEAQLADLEQKLVEAEAKNQRALSMAQQTKSGHVYIISNIGSFGENVYKIGMTRRLEPLDRVRELGDASVPFPFDVHAMIYCEDAPKLETELHRFFVQNQVNKVNPRKEFFRIPISDIKKEVEKREVEVKWTMTALASEYKETLAIERSMENNNQTKEEWIKQQKLFKETAVSLDEDENE